MTDNSNQPVLAMQANGYYNRNSSLQSSMVALSLPHFAAAAQSISVDGDGSLVVADYASSQGRNSHVPMRLAIDTLRARVGTKRPIEIFHTDLSSNDFTALFTSLKDDPSSYLVGTSNVFPFAVGRSYFAPILPPGRVHLGWNATSLHWLSQEIECTPHVVTPTWSNDSTILQAVRTQMKTDWRLFLSARSKELHIGGKIVLSFLAKKGANSGWDWVATEVESAITDMVETGLLSDEEKRRINFPIGFRSLDEIRAPFAEKGFFAGLWLEHAEIVDGPDPFGDDYKATGNAQRLGISWANMFRAVYGPIVARAIRPDRDRNTLIDALFARYAERISACPAKHESFHAIVVLKKE